MKDGSFVFLFRDDTRQEIFLVYRSDWPIWNIPGGGIEKGETPKQSALREAYEETGYKTKIYRPVGKKICLKKNKPFKTIYYFEGRVLSGTFQPEFPGCKGRWFKVNHLPVDLLDVSRRSILYGANCGNNTFEQTEIKRFCPHDLLIFIRHPIAGLRFITRK